MRDRAEASSPAPAELCYYHGVRVSPSTRDADGWRLRECGPGEVVPVRGVELSVSVAEVYAKAFGNRRDPA